jgi:integrase
MNVFIRYPNKPAPTYYARFTAPDPDRPGESKHYLRNTFETTKEKALKVLKQLVGAANVGRFDALELTKARHAPELTLEQIFTHYRAGAREITEATRRRNVFSMRIVVRKAKGLAANADVDQTPIAELTGDLVYKYRQAVLDGAQEDEADELRTDQLCRSANSYLRQAKSIFSKEMLSYYQRGASLALPPNLRDFTDELGFRKVSKLDYNKPNDEVLARTFQDLAHLETADPNLYRAVWAALGFGLRKSEIAAAKVGWFIKRDGVGYIRGDVLGKNGQIPDVVVQLGAWEKLAPHLAGRPADAFLLEGCDTERNELVFRRASTWMAFLGWGTQKRIHEFRAYAICQVAEQTGDLIEAQKWARHANYSTTEQNYGRYIRSKGLVVTLTVPDPTRPREFIPRLVGAE